MTAQARNVLLGITAGAILLFLIAVWVISTQSSMPRIPDTGNMAVPAQSFDDDGTPDQRSGEGAGSNVPNPTDGNPPAYNY